MKRKKLRSAKPSASAASARRAPRPAPASAEAAGGARPTAKRKTVARKKTTRRAPRARKTAVLPPPPQPVSPPVEAPLAAPAPGPKAQAAPGPSPAPAAPAPARPRPAAPPGQRALRIPPILLEGDERAHPVAVGPTEKFVLGPTPPPPPPPAAPAAPAAPAGAAEGELPAAYGTGKLFLTARDPHCLYAHWDFTEAQQRRFSAFAHHLALRLYRDSLAGERVAEMPLPAEARHSFVRVERAGATYLAQLGAYQPGGEWVILATSEPAATPPVTVAEDKTVRWAVVPPLELPAAPRAPQPEAAAAPMAPPVLPPPAVPFAAPPIAPQLHGVPAPVAPPSVNGRLEFRPVPAQPVEAAPAPAPFPPGWTPVQERVLAEVVEIALAQPRIVGSAEAAERAQHRIWREVGLPAAQPGASLPPGLPLPLGGAASLPAVEVQALGISSPAVGAPRPGRQFWFNLNVEVVVYGATEPDAQVTLGGRPVRLRPDGTFSCRFSLPDGRYELPAVAVSADHELRRADLTLGRRTDYHSEVGAHPQDPALRPPTPENIPAAQET